MIRLDDRYGLHVDAVIVPVAEDGTASTSTVVPAPIYNKVFLKKAAAAIRQHHLPHTVINFIKDADARVLQIARRRPHDSAETPVNTKEWRQQLMELFMPRYTACARAHMDIDRNITGHPWRASAVLTLVVPDQLQANQAQIAAAAGRTEPGNRGANTIWLRDNPVTGLCEAVHIGLNIQEGDDPGQLQKQVVQVAGAFGICIWGKIKVEEYTMRAPHQPPAPGRLL